MPESPFLHHQFSHVLMLVGIFLFLFSMVIFAPIGTQYTRAFGVSDIIDLSNEARLQLSRQPLKTNTALMNAAQMKAEDMVKEHYFAHSSPNGTVAWDYLKTVSYSYKIAGENLAITNENAQAVIDGWLNSPTHRENLLSNDYSDFGIGLAHYGNYQGHQDTYVVVAFYGQRASTQVITAATIPAGTSTALKPRILNISPLVFAGLASVLAAIGFSLEIRHLKRLNVVKV